MSETWGELLFPCLGRSAEVYGIDQVGVVLLQSPVRGLRTNSVYYLLTAYYVPGPVDG